jgi:hypothetical protein
MQAWLVSALLPSAVAVHGLHCRLRTWGCGQRRPYNTSRLFKATSVLQTHLNVDYVLRARLGSLRHGMLPVL